MRVFWQKCKIIKTMQTIAEYWRIFFEICVVRKKGKVFSSRKLSTSERSWTIPRFTISIEAAVLGLSARAWHIDSELEIEYLLLNKKRQKCNFVEVGVPSSSMDNFSVQNKRMPITVAEIWGITREDVFRKMIKVVSPKLSMSAFREYPFYANSGTTNFALSFW